MAFTLYVKTPGTDKAVAASMAPVGKAPRIKIPAGSKVIILDENHKVVAEVTQEAINNETVIIAKSGEQAEAVILEGDTNGAVVFDSDLGNWAGLTDMAGSSAVAAEGGAGFVPYALGGLAALGVSGAALGSSKGGDKEAPTFLSGDTGAAIAENTATGVEVYTAQARDTKSPVTFSLKAGSDADVTIDPTTGRVTLRTSPDFEAKPVLNFVVLATDAAGNVSEKQISLNIANRDEAGPTISSGSTATSINENSGAGQVVYTAAAADTDFVSPATASSITYSLKAGSDAGLTINPNNGRVTLAGNPDYETKNSYSFTVIATDAAGNATEKAVSLAIRDVNEDVVSPAVSSIALTSDNEGTYSALNAGDKVTLTVTMDENTIVNTTGGTPRVALTIGGTTVYATYAGGSGSKNLTFEYTLLEGQNDANGISIASNSISANGGTLRDAAGNSAALSHSAVLDNAGYVVDTIDPVATVNTVPAQPGTSAYVKFEATGNTVGNDLSPQLLVRNSAGDFVLTWQGTLADTSSAIFVQRCLADGTPAGDAVVLDASPSAFLNMNPSIFAVGNTGKYAVAWVGQSGNFPAISVYVQIFNGDGSTVGEAIKLDGTRAATDLLDTGFAISVLNSSGDFAVTWAGFNTTGPYASSIWVQKINEDGNLIGTPVAIDGVPSDINGYWDAFPDIAAVGNDGSFVVTWYGSDQTGQINDYSIFAQKFGPDGQPSGALQTLELLAPDQITQETVQKITALGQDGSYAITWEAYGGGDNSKSAVYVQKFAADGTAQGEIQRLDGIVAGNQDRYPAIAAVGTSGMYVVTWEGNSSPEPTQDRSIYVQLFNADGTPHIPAVKLDGVAGQPLSDTASRVIALGSTGEYAVSWFGFNSLAVSGMPADTSVFVQKFNADGSLNGVAQVFEVAPNNQDTPSQFVSLGDNGEFLLSWTAKDAENDYSVYLSKTYTTPGTPAGDPLGSSNEDGSLYLVLSTEAVSSEADILALSTDKFHEQTNGGANVETALDTTGLGDGDYKLYAVDHAGNLSAASEDVVTVGGAIDQLVFVMAEGLGTGGYLDDGDGVLDNDDVFALTGADNVGQDGFVDFANNHVTVEVLGIPGNAAFRRLDISGFGSDDQINVHLNTMQHPFGSSSPNIPDFNQTNWTKFIGATAQTLTPGDPGYLQIGLNNFAGVEGLRRIASTTTTTFSTTPMQLGIGIDTTGGALLLGFGPPGPAAVLRLLVTWNTSSNTQITPNEVTVFWPAIDAGAGLG